MKLKNSMKKYITLLTTFVAIILMGAGCSNIPVNDTTQTNDVSQDNIGANFESNLWKKQGNNLKPVNSSWGLEINSASIGTLSVTTAEEVVEQLLVYNAGHTATTAIGASSSTFAGPVRIQSDLDNALLVEKVDGTDIFRVNNANTYSYFGGPVQVNSRLITGRDTYLGNENGESSIISADNIYDNIEWAIGTQYKKQLWLNPYSYTVGGGTGILKDSDLPDTGFVTLGFNGGTNPNYSNNIIGYIYHNGNGLTFNTGAETGAGTNPVTVDNYISFKPRGVEKVRITGSGDVGIGTSTPQSKLHVSGTGTSTVWIGDLSGSNPGQICMGTASTTAVCFYADPATAQFVGFTTTTY